MFGAILAILFIMWLVYKLFGAYVKYLVAFAVFIVGLPFAIISGISKAFKKIKIAHRPSAKK